MTRFENRLEAGLSEIERGSGVDEVSGLHPQDELELRDLLRLAQRLRRLGGLKAPQSFRRRSRARLLERLSEPGGWERRAQRGGWMGSGARLQRAVLAAAATFLVVADAAPAAADSSSDQPLHAVKRGVERLQLAPLSDDLARSQLHLTLAGRRLEEAQPLWQAGQTAGLGTVKADFEAALARARRAAAGRDLTESELGQLAALAEEYRRCEAALQQALKEAPESARSALEEMLQSSREDYKWIRAALDEVDWEVPEEGDQS